MIVAHFIVAGEEREVREVSEEWLRDAQANQDNVLLEDGNPYRICNVQMNGEAPKLHACVELVAPQFTRAT